MNILSQERKALIQRLGNITPANGYRTEAGNNVVSGWFNEVIKAASVSFPIVVVQKGKDLTPKPAGHGIRKHSGYNVIAAVATSMDGYEDALDDLVLDLIECLMPIEGVALEWTARGTTQLTLGAAETMPPGDGLAAATAIIPLHFHTFIESRRN